LSEPGSLGGADTRHPGSVGCGILLLDKPAGLSSNAALQRVRRLLGARKAGHVGSLDPLATGMLPICLGEATKVAGEILSGRKRYAFTVRLGSRTATGDTEGAVVETTAVPALQRPAIEAVLGAFTGVQQQVPPMYSAIKRAGQPLYRLARSGIEVEREARTIELYELQLLAVRAAELEIEALCSKGTYIRTLAEDIARALGTCGHVTALRRLQVEPFEPDAMITLEAIAALSGGRGDTPGAAAAPDRSPSDSRQIAQGPGLSILPADAPLQHLPAVALDAPTVARLLHGQTVNGGPSAPQGTVRLYDLTGTFLGLGIGEPGGAVRARRLFSRC